MIRRARVSDAERLADLAERTFRETFEAANTRADMDAHCAANYGREIQAAEIADPNIVTLLGVDGPDLIGYAQVRWGAAPPCIAAKAPGEIRRIYVEKAWHGVGVARQLMDACMAEMIARHADVIWLGVWERNPRAQAFYRKLGFSEVGDHVFVLGSDKQRDIIMSRSLQPDVSKTPNKAPEPTPGLVTPRALACVFEVKPRNVNRDVARGAPSPVVAHL